MASICKACDDDKPKHRPMSRQAPSPIPESRAASAAFAHLELLLGKLSELRPRMYFINLRFSQHSRRARRPLARRRRTAYLRGNSAHR